MAIPKRSNDRNAVKERAKLQREETARRLSANGVQDLVGAEKQITQMLRLAASRISRGRLPNIDDLLALAPVAVLPVAVEKEATESSDLLMRGFSEELLYYLKRHPKGLLTLPGEVFEELVAELLAALGFEEISLRVRTDAGEVDILGFSRDVLGHRVGYVFELKQRGRSENLVELREITRLFGLRESLRLRLGVDHGVFVTTTAYTFPARQFAAIHRLSLKELQDVEKWLAAYNGSGSGLHLRPSPRMYDPDAAPGG